MEELVRHLRRLKVLKTPRLIAAFLTSDRKLFVPEEFLSVAYADEPLPIGKAQTISQPYTVAFMLELLQPRQGEKILDVGFGSGWTTAILGNIVGKTGKVYGLEISEELFKFGSENLQKLNLKNLELYHRSGWEGLSEHAPFDRILVSAAAPHVPPALKAQLAVPGRMVIPVEDSIKLLEQRAENNFTETNFPGFAFVPLVKK